MTSATFREQTETEDRRSWPVFQYVTYHIISHVGDKNCVKIVSILCNCHSGWALIWYYGFCYFQKQVFEPPHRRLEDRDEHQKNMEEAFEDMYMADTSMRSRCLYWMFQIKTIFFYPAPFVLFASTKLFQGLLCTCSAWLYILVLKTSLDT